MSTRFTAIIALAGMLVSFTSGTSALAQATTNGNSIGGSTGGSIDDSPADTIGGGLGDKSKSIPNSDQAVPDNTSFDGTWASAVVAKTCKGRLSGTFAVLNGRLIAEGVSGRIGPDGSAKGVNHYKGYIITWTGQFSHDQALGQWRRNDGCVGSWEAVRE